MVYVRTWVDEVAGEISYTSWMKCPSNEVDNFCNLLEACKIICREWPAILNTVPGWGSK